MHHASPSSAPAPTLASSSRFVDASAANAMIRFPRPGARAGAVIKSLLTTLCGAALLMTAADVLDPATLQAESTIAPRPALPRDAHQEFVRSLSSLVGQSHSVLAIKPRQDDRGAQLVLWLEDTHDLGQVDADELALIRHSPLFQTITLYTVSRHAVDLRPAELDPASPAFLDRWRSMSAVQARVIATGISDMRVEAISERPSALSDQRLTSDRRPLIAPPNLSHLRVHLTWSSDHADVADEATAVISVGSLTASSLPQEYAP